jgi:hypothetical protein
VHSKVGSVWRLHLNFNSAFLGTVAQIAKSQAVTGTSEAHFWSTHEQLLIPVHHILIYTNCKLTASKAFDISKFRM